MTFVEDIRYKIHENLYVAHYILHKCAKILCIKFMFCIVMDIVYYCQYCKFTTSVKSSIKQHITTQKHLKLAGETDDDYMKKRFKCVKCSSVFNDKSNATRHIKTIHSIEKKYRKKINIDNDKIDDIDVELTEMMAKLSDKNDSIELLKLYIKKREKDIKYIKEKDDEIKQMYKDEVEYHKKLTNNAGNIVNKTISAFTRAVTDYKDAPKLKLLDGKTANKLLCQEKIKGKSVKLDNNKTAEYIAKLSEQKILPKHLSNTLIEHYRADNPREQSVWTTDASRMKMIVKMDDNWIRDSNGKIINEHMIVPLINEMVRIIDQYNTSNGMNVGKMTRAQELKYAEVAMRILDIKLDVSSERINKEILKCLMPEFIMRRKSDE